MAHYDLHLSSSTLGLLASLRGGIRAVGVLGYTTRDGGCASCFLQTTEGEIVQISPEEAFLERRFEVFPIVALAAPVPDILNWTPLEFAGPIDVFLLQTEEWLDASAPCDGAVGEGPMLQCQGIPGSTPDESRASVRYFGGIEIVGSDKRKFTVASLIAPYVMHVSELAPSDQYEDENYVRVPIKSANHTLNPDAPGRAG